MGLKTVSVVIVSWNVRALLEKCLNSIYNSIGDFNIEIIVVDNNSSDDTIQVITQKFPAVKLIVNKENAGFARANNQGFKICKGEFVFILNPDTEIKTDTIQILLEVFENVPKAGMVGPKLLLPNGEIQKDCARRLQSLSSTLFCETLMLHKLPFVGNWFIKHYLFPYDHTKPQKVEAITGCAAMVRTNVLNEIGGFYDGYLHCGEDLELSNSINKKGLWNYYTPATSIIHYDKGSSRQASVRISVNSVLSIHLYFKRCKGAISAFFYKFIIIYIQMNVFYVYSYMRMIIGKLSKKDYMLRINIFNAMCRWEAVYDKTA
jgi:hypothetical protein